MSTFQERLKEIIRGLSSDLNLSIEKLDELLKNFEYLPDEEKIIIYYHKAYCLARLDKNYLSLKYYDKAIKSGFATHYIYSERSSIKSRLKDYNGSIEDLKKAFDLLNLIPHKNIEKHILLKNLGTVYQDMRDFSLSIKYFREAIDVNPNYGFTYIECATSIMNRTLQDYSRNQHGLLLALDYCNKGIDKIKSKDYANLSFYLNSLSTAHQIRARIYNKLKDKENELEDYHLSFYLDQQNHLCIFEMSTFFFKKQDVESIQKAIICIKIANLITKNSNDIYLFKLALYLGKWDKLVKLSDDTFRKKLKISSETLENFISYEYFKKKEGLIKELLVNSFYQYFESLKIRSKNLKKHKSSITELPTFTEIDKFYSTSSFCLFVSNEFIDSVINNNFYFSSIHNLKKKEPNESPIFNSKQGNFSKLTKLSLNNIFVRSLTANIKNLKDQHKMWEQYANNHQGVAIIFNIKKEWLLLNGIFGSNVKYVDKALTLNYNDPESLFLSAFYTKHKDYEKENEFRLIAFKPNSQGSQLVSWNDGIENGIQIKKICFGANACHEDINYIKSNLKETDKIVFTKIVNKGNFITDEVNIE